MTIPGPRLEYLKSVIIKEKCVNDPKDVFIDDFGNLVWYLKVSRFCRRSSLFYCYLSKLTLLGRLWRHRWCWQKGCLLWWPQWHCLPSPWELAQGHRWRYWPLQRSHRQEPGKNSFLKRLFNSPDWHGCSQEAAQLDSSRGGALRARHLWPWYCWSACWCCLPGE